MKFISTPSHGYLQVEREKFFQTVPLSKWTDFSYGYKDAEFFYLEEDCEAPQFLEMADINFNELEEVYSEEFDEARHNGEKFEGRKLSRF